MSKPNSGQKKIFIIAGEDSGDLLGGRLMAALHQLAPPTVRFQFIGIGGETMTAQGLKSLFPMKELSHFGFFAILPHLPKLIRRLRETVQRIKLEKPDLVITIDAPAFCLRVSSRLSGTKIPRIHYVAPQHWAWLPKRANSLRHETDKILSLLPFEPEFFAGYGVDCQFVGHPVIESAAAKQNRDTAIDFRRQYKIPATAPLLMVLPGSRTSEFIRHMPIFAESVRLLFAKVSDLRVVLAVTEQHLDDRHHHSILEGLKNDYSERLTIISAASSPDESDRFAGFAAADAALAVSGTVTLELALTQTPSVVAYRLDRMSWWLAQRLITVPLVALSNIVAKQEIMPELLQDQASAQNIVANLLPLLRHQAAYHQQKTALAEVARNLMADNQVPSLIAASRVLDHLGIGADSAVQQRDFEISR
ncbi:MAG: lipid-A-disaccharide synthase [Candidatus Pacebacteria bacterium]|nr:lipid-A-disaccharide synthase [Candidatus Paceibacterota bacterium]